MDVKGAEDPKATKWPKDLERQVSRSCHYLLLLRPSLPFVLTFSFFARSQSPYPAATLPLREAFNP